MSIKRLLVAAMSAGVIMSVWSITSLADSGWKKDDIDNWRYYVSDTEYLTDCWKSDNGNWYYLHEDGIMLKDCWAFIDGNFYYFGSSGAMQKNKWIVCGDADLTAYDTGFDCLYANPEYQGKKNYRYVGSDGTALTGWQKINGYWYFFRDKIDQNGFVGSYGLMKYGAMYDDATDSYYCFDGDGKMISDSWVEGPDGQWWYFGSDGLSYTGWKKVNGTWYYFSLWGNYRFSIANDELLLTIDDEGYARYCLFDSDGHYLGKGWHEFEDEWYYSGSNGYLKESEWLTLNGFNYYFGPDCKLITDKNSFFIDGKLYDFNSNGVCTNYDKAKQIYGWYELSQEERELYYSTGDFWAYVKPDGKVCQLEWRYIDGAWYYFDYYGRMYMDDSYTIDNKRYDFDSSGKCVDPYPEHHGWVKQYVKAFEEYRWFYFDPDGNLVSDWKQINGKWYFFDSYSGMFTNTIYALEDGDYYINKDGVMVTGWYSIENYDGSLEWIYSDSDGKMFYDGWKQINGKWYYFDYFHLRMNCSLYLNNGFYDFDENGVCTNPNDPRPMEVVIYQY